MQECIVGVPKERKQNEGRVGMTPAGVRGVVKAGGIVCVESGAGLLSGFSDAMYYRAGAVVTSSVADIWGKSDIVVKVKEPIPEEYEYLELMKGKTLFTYLHLAGVDIELTSTLLRHSITAIAYENVSEEVDGRMTFPLLIPMSKIAGKQAMRAALLRHKPEDYPNLNVMIFGGGNVGEAALLRAIRNNVENIVLFEAYEPRMLELMEKYSNRGVSVYPMSKLNNRVVRRLIGMADIFISCPMLPGGKEAPVVLTQNEFRIMKYGAYISDVSIDQGGSTAWTKGNPTKPGETFTRVARNLVFSAVPNIPGSTVPEEATRELTRVTGPYVVDMVTHRLESHMGIYNALRTSPSLRRGLQAYQGLLTNEHVASKHGMFRDYRPLDALF